MNNNKIIIGSVVALLVVFGIVVALASGNKTTTNTKNVDMAHTTHNNASQAPSSTTPEQPNSTAQATNNITYKGFAVSPKSLTLKKGTTVTWTNKDDAMHDVTPDTETADFKAGPLFGKGETYKVTFNTVGTYAYHCSPHPYMKGTIEVTE